MWRSQPQVSIVAADISRGSETRYTRPGLQADSSTALVVTPDGAVRARERGASGPAISPDSSAAAPAR